MPPLELTRRVTFAVPALLAPTCLALGGFAPSGSLETLERRSGGRLGVYAEGAGVSLRHRADERFPMCSSFKYLLAAFVMSRAQAGRDRLDEAVAIPASALIAYAPITEPASKAGKSLSVEALCEAAVKWSDNTAANLLLARSGGPAPLTSWLRGFDAVTRLDRNEPTLNESKAGDPRDTTTPSAMARDLDFLFFGPTLNERHRGLLMRWMTECQTGLHKLRAGLPTGWSAADKTGNNGVHTAGDIALLGTPKGERIVVACYVTQSKLRGAEQEAIFAEVGRIVSAVARG